MPIKATCALLTAALPGALDRAEYRTDDVFGFEVPRAVPGVDSGLRAAVHVADSTAHDGKAAELAAMFRANFEARFGRAGGAGGRRSRPREK